MIRKTLIAAAAVSALVLGNAAVPASAAVYLNSGVPALESNGYVQEAHHYVLKCKWVSVETSYGWKKKKVCRKVYPKHYSY